MNGFGSVSGITLTGARGFVQHAFLNPKSPSLEESVKHLVGMLAETNGYVSKEITNGFRTFNENSSGRVVNFARGPYLVDVGIQAIYPNCSNAQIDYEKSGVYVQFDTPYNSTSKAIVDLPKNLRTFYAALYDHNTGKMTDLKRLDKFTSFHLGDCNNEPYPSKEDIEHNYRPEVADNEKFRLSLLLFYSDESLITPSSAHW